MADLEGIISSAISEVGGGGDEGGTGGDDGGIATSGVVTDDGGGSTNDAPGATGEGIAGEGVGIPPATPSSPADDAFAKEHGLLNKAGQRENRIPYPRVVKIAENAERKLIEQVLGKAVEGDHKAALTAFVAENAAARTKSQALEARQTTVDQIEHIMVNEPERFMKMLPYVNPAYSQLFGGGGSAAPAAPQVPLDMPKPDYDLGNGQFTYSEKGLAELRAWDRKQTSQEVLGQVEQKFKPITDSWEARQRYEAAIPELTARVNHARQNWDGFKDNEAAILEVITSNKASSLHDAYIKVINSKQKEQLAAATTDRAKIRAELLAEINGAARSTASVPNAGAAKANAGEARSTEDIIKASIARLKG